MGARPSTLDHKALAIRIAGHFSTRFEREWVKWKLIADPLFTTLHPWLVEGAQPVIDVGCGRGLLGMYLRERGHAMPYLGLDFDEAKIAPAQAVAKAYDPPPQYVLQDARQPWPEAQGHVCLLDVLHYVPAAEQPHLLHECASHVAPGATFLLRSGIQDRGLRYRFTSSTDRIMAALRLMKSPPLHYPSLEEITSILSAENLHLIETQPPSRGSFFNNYLLVFRRSG